MTMDDEIRILQNAKERLTQKVRECLEAYQAEWLRQTPEALIHDAENIAAIQRMAKELPGTVSEEDAAYLLRFQNPLEVAGDYWVEMNGCGTMAGDDMARILWEIRDKQAAEQEYALEPEFRQEQERQMYTLGM